MYSILMEVGKHLPPIINIYLFDLTNFSTAILFPSKSKISIIYIPFGKLLISSLSG